MKEVIMIKNNDTETELSRNGKQVMIDTITNRLKKDVLSTRDYLAILEILNNPLMRAPTVIKFPKVQGEELVKRKYKKRRKVLGPRMFTRVIGHRDFTRVEQLRQFLSKKHGFWLDGRCSPQVIDFDTAQIIYKREPKYFNFAIKLADKMQEVFGKKFEIVKEW